MSYGNCSCVRVSGSRMLVRNYSDAWFAALFWLFIVIKLHVLEPEINILLLLRWKFFILLMFAMGCVTRWICEQNFISCTFLTSSVLKTNLITHFSCSHSSKLLFHHNNEVSTEEKKFVCCHGNNYINIEFLISFKNVVNARHQCCCNDCDILQQNKFLLYIVMKVNCQRESGKKKYFWCNLVIVMIIFIWEK